MFLIVINQHIVFYVQRLKIPHREAFYRMITISNDDVTTKFSDVGNLAVYTRILSHIIPNFEISF